MLLTTTSSLEGKAITAYHGLISSEVIVGANVIKDIFASFTDIFWGRSSMYEHSLISGKNQAIDELIKKAEKLGANAIIAIDLDFEAVGKWSMFMINAVGTAISFKE